VNSNMHRMVTKAQWPRGGALNDSSSVLLGADFDATGPRLSTHTVAMASLTKELNSIVAASLRDPSFVWSSLLVEVNTVAALRALPFALGAALTYTHGKHSGSVWVSGCSVPSGMYVLHHATHPVHLTTFTGFRVVVSAFLHAAAGGLGERDRGALVDAGFALPARRAPHS
jgi:hypothetical protein